MRQLCAAGDPLSICASVCLSVCCTHSQCSLRSGFSRMYTVAITLTETHKLTEREVATTRPIEKKCVMAELPRVQSLPVVDEACKEKVDQRSVSSSWRRFSERCMMSCHRMSRRGRLRRRRRDVTTGLNRARRDRRLLLTGTARFDKEMSDLQAEKKGRTRTKLVLRQPSAQASTTSGMMWMERPNLLPFASFATSEVWTSYAAWEATSWEREVPDQGKDRDLGGIPLTQSKKTYVSPARIHVVKHSM